MVNTSLLCPFRTEKKYILNQQSIHFLQSSSRMQKNQHKTSFHSSYAAYSEVTHNCDPEHYQERAPSLRRKKDVLGYLHVTMMKKSTFLLMFMDRQRHNRNENRWEGRSPLLGGNYYEII